MTEVEVEVAAPDSARVRRMEAFDGFLLEWQAGLTMGVISVIRKERGSRIM